MRSPDPQQVDKRMCADVSVEPEEQARADLYALLARLLYAAPDATMLAGLAAADAIAADQSNHPLDRAWQRLALAAGVMDPAAAAEEFNALFVSVGTPKINPYGSLYLSGFLNEQPLALLRGDLAQLRLARVPGIGEMEDHLGALCETMRVLVTGGPGGYAQPIERQKQFFETHMAPWYRRCLHDIRAADEANFYRLVADLAQAFFEVEADAFALDDASLAA